MSDEEEISITEDERDYTDENEEGVEDDEWKPVEQIVTDTFKQRERTSGNPDMERNLEGGLQDFRFRVIETLTFAQNELKGLKFDQEDKNIIIESINKVRDQSYKSALNFILGYYIYLYQFDKKAVVEVDAFLRRYKKGTLFTALKYARYWESIIELKP